jgi:micrococcal nuclease
MNKVIFGGKRKIISIPIFGAIALAFLPISLGLGLAWLVYKKVSNLKVRNSILAVVAISTLFIGSAWVSAMSSPTSPNKEVKQETSITPTSLPEAQTAAVEDVKAVLPSTTPSQTPQQGYKVVKVIDGDTIDVSIDGKTERIRFIGVDTPETVDPRKSVQCFGKEASAKTKQLLEGNNVVLDSDPTQGDKDKYSRLLRYVYLEDGTFVNKKLIEDGFGFEYTYNIPYKYQSEFKDAQKHAESSKIGLWADNACPLPTVKPTSVPTQITVKPTTQIKPTTIPNTNSNSTGACKYSCTSPDRDCSDFSTHSEAQSFFNCCGFTATNDPMKLDSVGVGDGVACESLP